MIWASQVGLVVKNPVASAGDIRDVGLISGLGRSPRGEHGNSLQCSCLRTPWTEGTWQARSIGLQNGTQLKQLSMYT